MEEKFSRVEKNENLYKKDKTDLLDIFLYTTLFVTFIFTLISICIIDTKALITNDITNAIGTTSECMPTGSSTQLNYYCAGDDNVYNDVWSKVPIGSGLSYETGTNLRTLAFKVNTGINANMNVTIEIYGSHFNNIPYTCHNSSVSCSISYVNSNHINLNFYNPSAWNGAEFRIYANNNTISSNPIYIYQFVLLQNEASSGGSSGGSSSSFDDTGIISNANQNTNDIINNQNQNTNSIITNQNTNTDILNNSIFDLLTQFSNVCPNLLDVNKFRVGVIQNNAGNTTSSSLGSISTRSNNNGSITFNTTNRWSGIYYNDYIDVSNIDYTYYVKYTTSNPNLLIKIAAYDVNKNFVAYRGFYHSGSGFPLCSSSIASVCNATNVKYVRFSIEMSGNPPSDFTLSNLSLTTNASSTFCPYGFKESKLDDIQDGIDGAVSGLNDVNDSVQDVNDTITNDNIDNGLGSSFFNDFTESDPGGISGIITKPLVVVNSLLSSNNQCANLQLPSFMNVSNAYLPSGCILWNNAPTSVITLWNIFVVGVGSYLILIDLFKLVEEIKSPTHNKVEVLDL